MNAIFPAVYSLCDYTGNWSRPYAEAGYPVINVDLKNGDDVRLLKLPKFPVVGVLAAPVCTMFALSGNGTRAREKREGTWEAKMREALALVDACFRFVAACRAAFPQDFVFDALENPAQSTLPHWIGSPRFKFNPCDFGGWIPGGDDSDAYTKQTGLWGTFGIPERKPVPAIHGSKMWRLYGGKSERTKTLRSATPMGFAYAFFAANNPLNLKLRSECAA